MTWSRQSLALAIATAAGAGYAPVAPGTFGSAAGLLIWAITPAGWGLQVTLAAVLFVAGSWSGTEAERYLRTTDPGLVVIDEVLGMVVTLAFISPLTWRGALVGFFLFRLFDIVKPFPVRRLEQLPGGVGIMADDFGAAIYANLALRACLWLLPSLR
jgi:phosphatidylglycerophosphatase A